MDERLLRDLLRRLDALERSALRYRKDADGNATLVARGIALAPHLLSELSADPPAPAANQVVIYAKDNGSGKTGLYARFATGAVQLVALEP